MARLDRYLLTQLLVLFGVFALVLVLMFWINQAVILFDRLIANGHSALIFLELSTLQLPTIVRNVMPLAAMIAVIWGINRLNTDSEIVVAQATGISPARLAWPVLVFGSFLAILSASLVHWLVPASLHELTIRQAEIGRDMTNRILREGEFIHPNGTTSVFIGEITQDGVLHDMMLFDGRASGHEFIYTTKEAILQREGDSAQLVMLEGQIQEYDLESGELSLTTFDDLVYDVTAMLSAVSAPRQRPRNITTSDILAAPNFYAEQLNTSRARMFAEVHARNATSLLTIVGVLAAFGALISGGFSRHGIWRQIGIAVILIAGLIAADAFATARIENAPEAWPAIYLGPIVGLTIALLLIYRANRPRRRRRRERGAA